METEFLFQTEASQHEQNAPDFSEKIMYKKTVVLAALAAFMVAGASAHKVDLSFLNDITINIQPQFDNGNTDNEASSLMEGLKDLAQEFLGGIQEEGRHKRKDLCKLAKEACVEDKKACEGALEKCPGIKECAEEKKECEGAIKRCKENEKACPRAKKICMDTKDTCMKVIKGCPGVMKECGEAKAKCFAAEKICRKKPLMEYLQDLVPQRDVPRRAGNPLVMPTQDA